MSVTIFALMTVGQWFQVAFDVCFPALVYRVLLYSMRVQVGTGPRQRALSP